MVEKLKDWYKEHKEEVMVFGPVIITASMELIGIMTKKKTASEEKRLKDRYVYDRSMGHYYEINKKIKPSDWLIIDHRRDINGERLGDILKDMRLIK